MKKINIIFIFQALIFLLLILTLLFNAMVYIYQVPNMEIKRLDWENYQYYSYRQYSANDQVLPYYEPYTDYNGDYEYLDVGIAKIPYFTKVVSDTKKMSFEGIDYSFKFQRIRYLNCGSERTPVRGTEIVYYKFGEGELSGSISLFNNSVLCSLYLPASDKFKSLSDPERQTEELAWKYLREGIAGYSLMAAEDENAKFKLVNNLIPGEYPYYDAEKPLSSRDAYEYIFVKYVHERITPEWIFMGFSENGQLLRYKRTQAIGVLTSELTGRIWNVEDSLLKRMEFSGYSSYDLLTTNVCLCKDALGRRYFLYTVNYKAGEPDLYGKVFIDEAVITDSYPLDKFIKTELILGAITVGFTLICCVTNILISRRKKSAPIPSEQEEQTE